MPCHRADPHATATAGPGTTLYFPNTLPRGLQVRRAYFLDTGEVYDDPARRGVAYRHTARLAGGQTAQGLSTGLGRRRGGPRVVFEVIVNGAMITGGRAHIGSLC